MPLIAELIFDVVVMSFMGLFLPFVTWRSIASILARIFTENNAKIISLFFVMIAAIIAISDNYTSSVNKFQYIRYRVELFFSDTNVSSSSSSIGDITSLWYRLVNNFPANDDRDKDLLSKAVDDFSPPDVNELTLLQSEKLLFARDFAYAWKRKRFDIWQNTVTVHPNDELTTMARYERDRLLRQ
ncbi:MAG: hypothetical protein P4M00_23580 [Azospirillaceae bacterium]|nr:hypothetical protein [Azospirillaceae bacterium]